MKTILLGLLLCGTATIAQTNTGQSSSASTRGNCSPALDGNNNQISITCTGLSAQKASDLIKVMNQILARQLDLKQVNDQLAQLHSAVENLSGAINPLDGASSEQVDLWQKAEQVISDCNALGSQWNRLNSSDYHQDHMKQVGMQESARYHDSLYPRAISIRDALLKQLERPQSEFAADYQQVSSPMQLSGVCGDLNSLRVAYYQKLTIDLKAKRDAAKQ